MKVLRGVLTFIVSFVLVILITLFTTVSSVKNIIQNQLIVEGAKQIILAENGEEAREYVDVIDEIAKSNGASEIVDSVLNEYTEYLEIGDAELSDDTVNLIINFCIDNKEKIEKITGEEVDVNKIRSEESKKELKEGFGDAVEEINIPRDTPVSSIIITYGKFTSNSFKQNLLIIILVLVVLLMLLSWSLYKWTKPLGTVLLTSGILVTILYLLIFAGTGIINKSLETQINIDANYLLISGIIEIVSGIILLVVYSIINKKKSPSVAVNFVSQVPVTEQNNIPVSNVGEDNQNNLPQNNNEL